ncbi:RluA family pseudouridine synthase [bacterium]|nr:RluA family pseudouridine synthase [bacterium]
MFGDFIGTDPPIRIDQWVSQHLSISRSEATKLIDNGDVTVNGCRVKSSRKVGTSDSLSVRRTVQQESPETPFNGLLLPTIIFDDTDIMVIEKPVGWTTHEVHAGQRGVFLTHWLVAQFPDVFSFESGLRPGIVHRLDQQTEGLMVIAKHRAALENLKDQFKNRSVIKGYYAAVKGNILSDELVIDQPIARASRGHKMVVSPTGKPAISVVTVLERYHSMTIVKVSPKSGRTHQIRVHMDFVGHPVLGDPLYGKSTQRYGQRLQAYFLEFSHPRSREVLQFEQPLSPRIKS